MGIFDRAVSRLDVAELSARLTQMVHQSLSSLGHAQRAGWSDDGTWYVECLGAECGFAAQGNRGGIAACDKMAEVHLLELKRD